jgi:hypothetical protein
MSKRFYKRYSAVSGTKITVSSSILLYVLRLDEHNRHWKPTPLNEMNQQIAVGLALTASNPLINAAASAVGVAKTGVAIGTLSGAAHTSATAAWIGLGSMKAGMFLMGTLPIIGTLLILDSISGGEEGSPIIDWYEESWRQYEAQCELEDLKKEVKVDYDHQLRAKRTAITRTHQEAQFQALEVEQELHLLKKKMEFGQGKGSLKAKKVVDEAALIELDYESSNVLNTPNMGLKVRIKPTGITGFIISEFFHTKLYKHMLEIKPVNGSYSIYAAFVDVDLLD